MSNSLLTVDSCGASFLRGPCQPPPSPAPHLSQKHGVTLVSGSLLPGAVLPMLRAGRQLVTGASVRGDRCDGCEHSGPILSMDSTSRHALFYSTAQSSGEDLFCQLFPPPVNRWITGKYQQSRRNGFRLPLNLSPTTESSSRKLPFLSVSFPHH